MDDLVYRWRPELVGIPSTRWDTLPTLDPKELAELVFERPPLTVFTGPNKTEYAMAAIKAAAVRVREREPVFRGRLLYARPSDFAEYHNALWNPDYGQMDVYFKGANYLVIDDLHLVEKRFREEAVILITDRVAWDKATTIAVPDITVLDGFPTEFVKMLVNARVKDCA